MALANLDMELLRRKVQDAYKLDEPQLAKYREYARRLKQGIRPLKTYIATSVSFVSADGGDNRLVFNPILVELIRVVDSRGNQCALDAISSTTSLAELEAKARNAGDASVVPVRRLCNDLNKSLREMSYLIRALDQPGKSTGALRCYRDMVEWAVLYDLATNPNLTWGGNTILVRDGLLRTKSFTREVFPLIDAKLREAVWEHAKRNVTMSLVGVAKQSAVLGRLAVALEIEGTFHKKFPCYVQVPDEIEADCYNYDRTWLDTYATTDPNDEGKKLYQSLGKLFLVKFGDQEMDPVWPIDIAEWQVENAPQILGQLTRDAQEGFPIPNYPMCIQRAHDFAKLTGLEISILQDLLVSGMSSTLSNSEVDRLLRMKYLGQNLAALRYKEG